MAEEFLLAEVVDFAYNNANIEVDATEHPAILAWKAKGQAEQATGEAKDAVAEYQKELLRGATPEIILEKLVASRLAREHAATLVDVQKRAEEVAEQVARQEK